jgi:hypothetical protein
MSKADWQMNKRKDWYLKAFEAALARHLGEAQPVAPLIGVPRAEYDRLVVEGGCIVLAPRKWREQPALRCVAAVWAACC